MKLGQTLYIPAILTLSLAAMVGCGDDTTDDTKSTTSSSTSGSGGGGTGGGGGGAGGGAPAGARLRVAHLSPDAPAVDFCASVDGGMTFALGPVLALLATDADGLAYSQVTQYFDVPATTYAIRLVAPGSQNCDTPLGPPDVTGVKLDAGVSYTAAAIGQVGATGTAKPFAIAALVDDLEVAEGFAQLRFVHAGSDAPAVDVGVLAGADFTPVFSNVAFNDVVAPAEIPAVTNVTVAVRVSGTTTNALEIPGVSLAAGDIATAFAIGTLAAGTTKPLKALVCRDNAEPVSGLTPCNILPQ